MKVMFAEEIWCDFPLYEDFLKNTVFLWSFPFKVLLMRNEYGDFSNVFPIEERTLHHAIVKLFK